MPIVLISKMPVGKRESAPGVLICRCEKPSKNYTKYNSCKIINSDRFSYCRLYICYPLRVYMKECMDSENLHRRLKKIAGQINAIDRMIDEDVPCEDILIQVNAVKSAVHKVGEIILEGHLNHCVREGIEHGDAEKTIQSFAKAVENFSKI